MGNFTFEEMNLMCIYNTGSRITKLCAMTDEKFAELELYPDFDQ